MGGAWLIKQSMTGDSAAGDVVLFSISVANHGSADATNLNLVDTLPPGLTLVDASGQYRRRALDQLSARITGEAIGHAASDGAGCSCIL